MELGKKLLSIIRRNGMAGKVLLIGDTTHDFEVARELEIDCILVSHGHQDKERLTQHGVPVFDSFNELKLKFEMK